MTLEAAPLGRADRVVVSLVPGVSPLAGLVREAARAAGAEFSRAPVDSPADLQDRVLIVDLTQVLSAGRLGPSAIAISTRPDLDCYDVIPPDHVRWRLKRAVRNLVERERLRRALSVERETVRVLNEIGHALSAQTSLHALLDTLLTRARRLLQADGGSIYLVEGDHLRFTCAQNDTIPFRASRLELPLDTTSLAGRVAVQGEPLHVPEVTELPDGVRPELRFDRETGYRTRSMLFVPMKDHEGAVLGVLALINRKPEPGLPLTSFDRVEPFAESEVFLAGSIASQAAVAIENYRLYREIRTLFDGFVDAAVTAIEARDPSTGGHSHRVAALTTALARAAHDCDEGPWRAVRFSPAELTELHYAAMLHDFGKVGVREEVLLKADKLYPWELSEIEGRFRVAGMQVLLEALREDLSRGGAAARPQLDRLERDLELVRRLNQPGVRPSEDELRALDRVQRGWDLPEGHGRLVTPREAQRLCIPIGSLDPDERREIERHVTHTHNFLKAIPWTRDLAKVPELAWCHHEKLDGTGYPRQLKAPDIPLGARLMTIADIFDALTAGDRPYKAGMSPDAALQILRDEAGRGRVEGAAVDLLAQRRLWVGVVQAP